MGYRLRVGLYMITGNKANDPHSLTLELQTAVILTSVVASILFIERLLIIATY